MRFGNLLHFHLRGNDGEDNLFHANHHRIGPAQVLDTGLIEAGFAHPRRAIRTRIIESAVHFDQRVQTHQQPKGVALSQLPY